MRPEALKFHGLSKHFEDAQQQSMTSLVLDEVCRLDLFHRYAYI